MDPLVCQVDAKLLKAVGREVFVAENIENADFCQGLSVIRCCDGAHGLVDARGSVPSVKLRNGAKNAKGIERRDGREK